jgi:reactive intermediate/imine deaminase
MPARASLFGTLALLALALLPAPVAAQAAEAQAPIKQVVLLPGSPANPNLSPGVRSRNFLFASGALPATSVGPDIKAQTASSLNAIRAVVEAGGSTMANVVKCSVFLTSAADFAAMNEIYVTYFPTDPPARSTVVVAALVRADAKIEIECIAALPR